MEFQNRQGNRQVQKQKASSRTLQMVEVLQMTASELYSYVNEMALENPVMDIEQTGNPGGGSDSFEQQRISAASEEEYHYLYQRRNNDDDIDGRERWNIRTDDSETLEEYLKLQLFMEEYSKKERAILEYLMGIMDDNGYIRDKEEEIVDVLGVGAADIERMIDVIQRLDPAGVGARNLEECLKLQLQRRGNENRLILRLIEDDLDLIARNQISSISRKYRVTAEEAAQCCQMIKSLIPKPGSSFSNRERLRYIIPDVAIVKFEGRFDIMLNESLYPVVEVNSYYADLEKREETASQVREYLGSKIAQAEWIQSCITQRRKTMMTVSRLILERQEDFFLKGPGHLVPLSLAEAAVSMGVHESTVSRAVRHKYLQCIWGVYPMKYFFSRSVTRQRSEDSAVSRKVNAAAIKRELRRIIESENKKKPYSDRILSEKLKEKGITISRRTVAKYREEEGIYDVSGRKDLEG